MLADLEPPYVVIKPDVREEAPAGRLESSVIQGFWIDPSWLWEEDLPSSLACLRRILAGN